MLIEYAKPNVLTLPVLPKKAGATVRSVLLSPGINQVDKKDWDVCKDLPKIKRLVAEKKIKVCVGSDDTENEFALGKLQVKDAAAAIKKTYNILLLENWKHGETRPGVLKAINAQIAFVEEKTAPKKAATA